MTEQKHFVVGVGYGATGRFRMCECGHIDHFDDDEHYVDPEPDENADHDPYIWIDPFEGRAA